MKRETNETRITASLVIEGGGAIDISTGLPFFDHMLTAFARHAGFDLTVDAAGDLEVDAHHTMEDTGLVLGRALRDALGERAGIVRFGSALVPMDDALARAVVDVCGRPYLVYAVKTTTLEAGGIHVRLFQEFFRALTTAAGLTLHVNLLAGEEVHHSIEAVFKAFGRALAAAAVIADPRGGVPSTKGVLD